MDELEAVSVSPFDLVAWMITQIPSTSLLTSLLKS